jgi:hypothetical protein
MEKNPVHHIHNSAAASLNTLEYPEHLLFLLVSLGLELQQLALAGWAAQQHHQDLSVAAQFPK